LSKLKRKRDDEDVEDDIADDQSEIRDDVSEN